MGAAMVAEPAAAMVAEMAAAMVASNGDVNFYDVFMWCHISS